MKVRLLHLWLGAAADTDATALDYVIRSARIVPTEMRRLKAAAGDGERARQADGARARAAVPSGFRAWRLDPEGRGGRSGDWAEWLAADLERGGVAMVVGGAAGLETPSHSDDRRVTLSSLTFPHALARLLAAEQAYRALTIWKRIPYHK